MSKFEAGDRVIVTSVSGQFQGATGTVRESFTPHPIFLQDNQGFYVGVKEPGECCVVDLDRLTVGLRANDEFHGGRAFPLSALRLLAKK